MTFAKLKYLLPFLILNSFFTYVSFGQDNIESQIEDIKSEIKNIKKDSAQFKMSQKDFSGYSSEGGVIKKYYVDNTIRMIELTAYGETGQSASMFFVVNSKLICLTVTEQRYKAPIYMGKPEVKSVEENQYYFKDQKLIRWTKNKNTIMDSSSYIEKQIEIILYYQTLILPDKPTEDKYP